MMMLLSFAFGIYALWVGIGLFGCETVWMASRTIFCAPDQSGVVSGWLAGTVALAVGVFFAGGPLLYYALWRGGRIR